MSSEDDEAPARSPSVADLMRTMGLTPDDETSAAAVAAFEAVCLALGHAVIVGQLFETYVRIAGPVLDADGTDDKAARKELDKGLGRNANRAIDRLLRSCPGLIARLHDTRRRRNSVVHDGLLGVLIGVVSADVRHVTADLEAASAELMEVVEILHDVLWPHVVSISDIGDVDPAVLTAGILGAAFQVPGLLDGVTHLTDFNLVFEELVARLEAEE